MIKSSSNFNLHPLMENKEGNKILDYRSRTRLDEKFIPQNFNNRIVFQSFSSFQQNNLSLSKQIRTYVQAQITTSGINAIGGESYLYDINKEGIFHTNSKSIITDAEYNGYFNVHCIDYTCSNLKDEMKITHLDTVVNLSKLNTNIMCIINQSISNKIIVINCHHKDFWKKRELLTNYKLYSRKQFVDYTSRYFITVSVFLRKKAFVPLGGNCSVCYHLKGKGLRNTAYPFDWCQIKLGQVLKVLENDFKDYTKTEIKKFSENHENSYIISNPYCRFAHEVKNVNGIEYFQEQLLRRIERLKTLKNPIFIRNETFVFNDKDVYTKYWKKITSKLDKMFNKQYKIILISDINPNIDIVEKTNNVTSTSNIKWIKYNSKIKGWKKSDLPWNIIFQM